MIQKKIKAILCFVLLFSMISVLVVYAVEYDKAGHIIPADIIRPTAESTIDPDTLTEIVRKKVDTDSKVPVLQNIHADGVLIANDEKKDVSTSDETIIRHLVSIADVEDGKYKIIEDHNNNRIRLKIRNNEASEWYATNGFYRVNGKVFYFDEDGFMVLGKARDDRGKTYFFSYETGEMQ